MRLTCTAVERNAICARRCKRHPIKPSVPGFSQLLLEPAALLGLQPLAVLMLMAVRTVSCIWILNRRLGLGLRAAASSGATAVLGTFLVAWWRWRCSQRPTAYNGGRRR